jgi:iron complex outermembrane recepter protein
MERAMTKRPWCPVLLVWLVVLSLPAVAQETAAPAGAVTGVVQGPDGARLPGVAITLSASGVVAQVVSGDMGAYRISGLRPGRYRVRAELQGFRAAETEFQLAAQESATIDLRLPLDALVETVNVVGSAERASVEPARIRESGARDVGESLAGLAGVWKVRRGAIASDIVVRGYQNDNLTVLIDGARLYGACPNNMDHTAFHVDFAEVDRVEIGKGPFDLKNQGGLGAAVNIVTKRPGEGFHANPQLSFGSYGYVNPSVTASFGTRSVAGLAGYSYRAADPYKDGDGRSFLQPANYKSSALTGRAYDVDTAWTRVDLARGTAHGLQFGYTRQRAGEVLYPYLQMDAVYDNADRANLAYELKRSIGFITAAHAQAYATRVEHWMTDDKRLTSNGMARAYSMATMARTDTGGGKVEVLVPGATIGFEMYQRGWDTKTQLAMMKYQEQASIPNVTVTSAGVYAEYSKPIGEAVRLDLGGRIDRTRSEADPALANTTLYTAYHGASQTSAVDTYPSGKVRLSYKLTSALTLSGGLGHTVRVPDPQERYFALRRAGTDWVGNPFLRPVQNTGVEMNLAYRAGRLYLNGNLHRDALTDAIGIYNQARRMAVAGMTNASARSYRNVSATMSGVEVDGVFPVTDRLFLSGDVSVTRGKQEVDPAAGVNSEWLSEMPPARSRLALRYERRGSARGLFAEVEGIYSAAQNHVDTDLKESPTPAYAIANLRVGGNLWRMRLAVGVGNLFDETYTEHLSYQRDPFRTGVKVYEPGRNVYANVSLVF